MSVARPALFAVTLAAAVALAGCNKESQVATTAKASQPLSPQLVSLMTEKQMTPRDPILLRVFKEEAKAEVWKKRRADGRYALLKTYDICRFSGKLGPKIKEGDKQAPEGFYQVTPAQMNPKSSYYLSFNLGFPNAYDQALGRTGRHVMMHGDCLSAGCYAMTDDQMAEIYAMARESFRGGQAAFQVQAMPFRMTAQNIARRRSDKNMPFWKNLKQGSDAFEVTKLEPKVDACGKKYVFNAKANGFSGFNPGAGCPGYQVEPTIAKAVQAKEKADNIVIAALSKTEPHAPEYVAQNGRMRRTLDQPIVMIAAVAPEAAGVPVVAEPASGGEMQLASVAPARAAPRAAPSSEVAPRRTQGAAPSTPPAAPAAATQVASIGSGTAARPATGPREVGVEQPVMASSAPENTGTIAKLKGWMGGLIGGKSEEPAPAAPVVEPIPVSTTAPAAAQPKRSRSAGLPPQLAPKAVSRSDRSVTSSFAPEE